MLVAWADARPQREAVGPGVCTGRALANQLSRLPCRAQCRWKRSYIQAHRPFSCFRPSEGVRAANRRPRGILTRSEHAEGDKMDE
jgi:hypothetical protein